MKEYEKKKPWTQFDKDLNQIDPDIKIDTFLEFGRSRLDRIKILLDLSISAVSDVATAGILGMGANFTQHVIELTPKLVLISVNLFWENMGGFMKQQSRTNPEIIEKYYKYVPDLMKNIKLTRRNIRMMMLDHGKEKLENDNSTLSTSFDEDISSFYSVVQEV